MKEPTSSYNNLGNRGRLFRRRIFYKEHLHSGGTHGFLGGIRPATALDGAPGCLVPPCGLCYADLVGGPAFRSTLIVTGAGMGFTDWVKSGFSHRGKAVSFYRSGMAKANKHNYDGAIADYSAAIREPSIPPDVKAMVLYNRALAYSATHEDEKSAEDLAAILEMPGLPQNIRTQAKQRQERIRRRRENADSP